MITIPLSCPHRWQTPCCSFQVPWCSSLSSAVDRGEQTGVRTAAAAEASADSLQLTQRNAKIVYIRADVSLGEEKRHPCQWFCEHAGENSPKDKHCSPWNLHGFVVTSFLYLHLVFINAKLMPAYQAEDTFLSKIVSIDNLCYFVFLLELEHIFFT